MLDFYIRVSLKWQLMKIEIIRRKRDIEPEYHAEWKEAGKSFFICGI